LQNQDCLGLYKSADRAKICFKIKSFQTFHTLLQKKTTNNTMKFFNNGQVQVIEQTSNCVCHLQVAFV